MKLQQEQNQIQARIDNSVYVTHAHFETEFNAMKELFGLLSTTKLLLPIPRATMRISSRNETDKERREQLSLDHGKLADGYSMPLQKQFEALSPFYTPELYKSVKSMQQHCLARTWANSTRKRANFRQQWYVEGTTNRQRFS